MSPLKNTKVAITAFELVMPGAEISQAATAFFFENYAAFYDKYVVAA